MIIQLFCLFFSLSCFADNVSGQFTLEKKVGQLLIVHFQGEKANLDAQNLIQEIGVGGFIYYNWANSLHSPEQVLNLSQSLQNLAQQNPEPIPLLIAIDQEGGRVTRLTSGFTQFPGNCALGLTEKPDLAKQSAFVMGEELKAVGVNINFAPVIDINDPNKNIMGERTFGSSPDIVISFAAKAIEGFHAAGVIATLKHFPGHGSTEKDSHCDLPLLNKTKKELAAFDLLPFAKLAQNVDAIMTAHILVPAIDSENCATLSKPMLDILRNEIGFNGVIISDSLVMQGLLNNCISVDEAAIKAFNAGCDLILLGGKQLHDAKHDLELKVADIRRIHRALVKAVIDGRINEERLNASVDRILTLKSKYGLFQWPQLMPENLHLHINTDEHRTIAEKISRQNN